MVRMGLKRALSISLAIGAVALAGFHGWVFAAQAAAGRLDDPWVILRWIVGTAIVVALAALRRRGESMWGRKAIAIWGLAALLHAPSVAKNSALELASLPERAVVVMLEVASAVGLGASIFLLGALAFARRRELTRFAIPCVADLPARMIGNSLAPRFAPRPPPARA